jgi:hypothetical protein
MKKIFFPMLILFFACTAKKPLVVHETTNFPASWSGNWLGTLNIYSVKGLSQTVPMEIEIAKIDTSENRYVCALIYGEDKIKGRRNYELVIKDPSKGLYVNDEKNTIAMESYLIDNKLYCYFLVMGNFLTSTMEKKDADTMLFEITSGSDTPVSKTGNQIFKGDTIPEVKTFPIRVVQKAVLKKKNISLQ